MRVGRPALSSDGLVATGTWGPHVPAPNLRLYLRDMIKWHVVKVKSDAIFQGIEIIKTRANFLNYMHFYP